MSYHISVYESFVSWTVNTRWETKQLNIGTEKCNFTDIMKLQFTLNILIPTFSPLHFFWQVPRIVQSKICMVPGIPTQIITFEKFLINLIWIVNFKFNWLLLVFSSYTTRPGFKIIKSHIFLFISNQQISFIQYYIIAYMRNGTP